MNYHIVVTNIKLYVKELGKYVSIDYVLVGTGCRIYVVYAYFLIKKMICKNRTI